MGLLLLQGLAGNLSIAHKHTLYCSCLLEVTLQDLIHFCQQKALRKCTYQAAKCNKLGLLTCC